MSSPAFHGAGPVCKPTSALSFGIFAVALSFPRKTNTNRPAITTAAKPEAAKSTDMIRKRRSSGERGRFGSLRRWGAWTLRGGAGVRGFLAIGRRCYQAP